MTKARLLREIERRKAIIAKQRDELRDLIDDAGEICTDSTEAIESLEYCVETLSRNL